jgi:cystinosin
VGLSFDFISLNLLGFTCYSAYNCALFYSPSVRAEYLEQYGSYPAVQTNDVFFGLHAIAATLVTIVQMFVYERGEQRVSRPAVAFLVALLLSIVIAGGLVAAGTITMLTFLLTLSYLKLAISITKYTPQAILNYQRKSTVGWSIHNVLLDFAGGSLSVAQLVMDCLYTNDWSGVRGDPVKFGLGFTSMVFDVVFFTQHYFLYPGAKDEDGYEAVAGKEWEA